MQPFSANPSLMRAVLRRENALRAKRGDERLAAVGLELLPGTYASGTARLVRDARGEIAEVALATEAVRSLSSEAASLYRALTTPGAAASDAESASSRDEKLAVEAARRTWWHRSSTVLEEMCLEGVELERPPWAIWTSHPYPTEWPTTRETRWMRYAVPHRDAYDGTTTAYFALDVGDVHAKVVHPPDLLGPFTVERIGGPPFRVAWTAHSGSSPLQLEPPWQRKRFRPTELWLEEEGGPNHAAAAQVWHHEQRELFPPGFLEQAHPELAAWVAKVDPPNGYDGPISWVAPCDLFDDAPLLSSGRTRARVAWLIGELRRVAGLSPGASTEALVTASLALDPGVVVTQVEEDAEEVADVVAEALETLADRVDEAMRNVPKGSSSRELLLTFRTWREDLRKLATRFART